MTIYIALLRGINVGGKNIIKMVDLKRSFSELGFYKVQTYIQSGNVLFASDEEEDALREKIEQKILEDFGISLSVVLRTDNELEQIIENCPFSDEEIAKAESASEGESFYVALLTKIPMQEKIELLHPYESETDKCRIKNRDVYLLFSRSIRNSKLANNLHKLDVPTTVRNWKTINKLAGLAKGMEEEN